MDAVPTAIENYYDGNLSGTDVFYVIGNAIGLGYSLKPTPKTNVPSSHVASDDGVPNGPSRIAGASDDVLGQVDNVMLERLRLGADIDVPAGTQNIRQTMSDLSVVSGNEVALIRLPSGRRVIRMGGPNAIDVKGSTRVIAHTHPQGSLLFSDADTRVLNARGQRSSVLIAPREDIGVRVPVPRSPQ